ncbi:MAG: RES family NAD+ phosphorylase [Arenimonas sp.]
MVTKRRNPRTGALQLASNEQGTDGVLELDRFTSTDLERWNRLSETLDYLHSELHYGFESQRNTLRKELIEALQSIPAAPFDFKQWCRVVPHRYSLIPLSAAGSLFSVGGRFNIGRDIPTDVRAPWPALYLASDPETALREKYGLSRNGSIGGLTREELALMPRQSHTTVVLNGHIEQAFDLTDLRALVPFCKVLAKFKMPHGVDNAMRRLRIDRRKVRLVRTPAQLQKAVMASNWRQWPIQFEVPAHGQIFASLVIAAGYEAIRYPSSKSGQHCLAIFPQNIASSRTYIELADSAPPETAITRLDMGTADACCGSISLT